MHLADQPGVIAGVGKVVRDSARAPIQQVGVVDDAVSVRVKSREQGSPRRRADRDKDTPRW